MTKSKYKRLFEESWLEVKNDLLEQLMIEEKLPHENASYLISLKLLCVFYSKKVIV